MLIFAAMRIAKMRLRGAFFAQQRVHGSCFLPLFFFLYCINYRTNEFFFVACLFALQIRQACRAMFSLRCEHTRGLRGYVPDGAARRLASIRRASGSFGLAGRNARKCGEIQNS